MANCFRGGAMTVEYLNGLSSAEADSVVAVGCILMASGLAGAVGQGVTAEGACFVEIMAPHGGVQMFVIGKERGRYFVRGQDGGRLAAGRTLDAMLDTGFRPETFIPARPGRPH